MKINVLSFISEAYRVERLHRKKHGLIRLVLKKKGQYKDNSLFVRDLRFVSNKERR